MTPNNKFDISHYQIGENKPCFIIAEVGQNHQGDINIAKQLIRAAKEAGANCVKFQKTCLEEKFNALALKRPYTSQHSWGKTYGDHKSFLEFSVQHFKELQKYAKEIGIMFSASAMDCASIDVLEDMDVPFLKIGSGDANNFLLLEYAASKQRPLIISTGMQSLETVREIYWLMKKMKAKFSLLHCVSSYPPPFEQINLRVLNLYQSEFPDIQIGYSGHELGTTVSIAAVAMGAKILERHITLDTSWKGNDHKCSLTPEAFKRLVNKIRLLETALGEPCKTRQPCENACYQKLGKTVVASGILKSGTVLSTDHIKIKVAEPKGWAAEEMGEILGRKLKRDIQADESIAADDLLQE